MRSPPSTICGNLKINDSGGLARFFEIPKSRLHQLVDNAHNLYQEFEIPKKSGGTRLIRPPSKSLRDLQRTCYKNLATLVRFPPWVNGGVHQRSIFTHASTHIGQTWVAVFDFGKFFPSITCGMLADVFARFGIGGSAAEMLVRLTSLDNALPQGAPTSCFLANLAVDSIDRQLVALGRKHEIVFSRYVDDLAFSSTADLRNFEQAITQIASSSGLQLAADKTKIMSRSERQIITSLVVNKILRPTREFIVKLDEDIWTCLKIGPVAIAMDQGISVQALKLHLSGRISHLHQADPNQAGIFRKRVIGIDWNRRENVGGLSCAQGLT